MLFNNHESGKVLTDAEVGALVHDNQLEGFLTKSDIELLLDQPDCVGIRLYLAIESAQDRSNRVIGVGIRGNGTEKDGRGGVGYRMSQPFDNTNARNAIELASRATATQKVQLAMDEVEKERVSAFFSADMLHKLLEDKQGDPVIGIGFYLNELDGTLERLLSPIAASFVSNNGTVQRVNGNPLFSHIQSLKPCPGFCATLVNETEDAEADSNTTSSFSTKSSVIYLVKWDA